MNTTRATTKMMGVRMILRAQTVPTRIAMTVVTIAFCGATGLVGSTAIAEQVSVQANSVTKSKDTTRLPQFSNGSWFVSVSRAWSPPQKAGVNSKKEKSGTAVKTQNSNAEKDLFRPDPTYDKEYSAK